MDLTFFLSAFVTLFVVIDPLGLAPMFVALTAGETEARRRALAVRACGVAFVILTVFGLFGEQVLGSIGISMGAFRIAGGVLLFITALDMLFERRTQRRSDKAEDGEDRPDPSVFPLAIPLIAGPGAIAAMILLTGTPDVPYVVLGVHVMMAIVVLIVLVFFLLGGLLERALGRTGILVVTRVLGMLLAALAVQFVLDGLADVGILAD